ncbi:MAG: hypothetical protein PHV36_12765 [Elusimicrobiales bacterium]|nr:hypothetical protein [Elusimicrobiales bacterium]
MGFKERKKKTVKEGKDALLEKYSALLAGVKLRPPALPRVLADLPGKEARKYPVLQELAAARQDIQDEFSKRQLELLDIKSRIEEDIAAVSKSRPAQPAPELFKEPAAAGVPAERAAQPESEPELQPGPGPRRFPAWFIAAAAVCAAVFGLYKYYAGLDKFSLQLPFSSAVGLCLDPEGGRVFLVDPQRQVLLTVVIAENRIKAMQSFPSEGLKALAFDGSSFWSSDGDVIRRHGPAGGYAALSAYKPWQKVSFLCWDGNHLWAASSAGELTRYIAGQALKPEDIFSMPKTETVGISISGEKLWLLDPESGKLSSYRLGLKPEPLNSADVKALLPRGAVTGFAINGEYLWVLTAAPAELSRINLKNVKLY